MDKDKTQSFSCSGRDGRPQQRRGNLYSTWITARIWCRHSAPNANEINATKRQIARNVILSHHAECEEKGKKDRRPFEREEEGGLHRPAVLLEEEAFCIRRRLFCISFTFIWCNSLKFCSKFKHKHIKSRIKGHTRCAGHNGSVHPAGGPMHRN